MLKLVDGDYLDVTEAAELLEIHPESVRRKIRNGSLVATKISGTWYIKKLYLVGYKANYTGLSGRPVTVKS